MRALQDPNILLPVVGTSIVCAGLLIWAFMKAMRAWRNRHQVPIDTGAAGAPADLEAAMGEAVLGRWHWIAAALVVTVPAILAVLGHLDRVDAGIVSFFGTIAVFATRFVFASDQVLTHPKMTTLIGSLSPVRARICLGLLAVFGWTAVIVALAEE